ncbi:MAG TPA: hypothetical protein VL426_06425 [Candidatus Binatia bacterium]|jgi:hypothetical protein|nr:hypothetical protein [Candidatus Binatia bacterium]
MEYLFAWQNLIFLIPLAVGILLVFGSAFGGSDHDADHDVDHDVGHDAGHGHDGHDGHKGAVDPGHASETFVMKALSLLGVGKVPLTAVLMMMSLLFGGFGMVLNMVLSSLGLPAWIYGPVSAAAACIGMFALTGRAVKLLNRFMPTNETYRVSRHDFAGCTGKLLLPANSKEGYAQVKDHEGNVHNVKCRTIRGELPKGGDILVIEYDEENQTCIVDASPVSSRSLS